MLHVRLSGLGDVEAMICREGSSGTLAAVLCDTSICTALLYDAYGWRKVFDGVEHALRLRRSAGCSGDMLVVLSLARRFGGELVVGLPLGWRL